MSKCRDCKHWAFAESAPASDWNPPDLHPCRGAPLYPYETVIGSGELLEHVNLPRLHAGRLRLRPLRTEGGTGDSADSCARLWPVCDVVRELRNRGAAMAGGVSWSNEGAGWTVRPVTFTAAGPRYATPEEVAAHERTERELARVRRLSDAYFAEPDPYVRRALLVRLCGESP